MDGVLRLVRLPVFLIGMALIFAAERYFPAETYHLPLLVTGYVVLFLGFALTMALSVVAGRKGLKGESKSWRLAMAWQGAVLGGLLLYLAYDRVLGSRPAPETPADKILLAAWLVTTALGLFAGAGIEWSLRESGLGPLAEPSRVGRTARAWVAVGMLAVFLVGANYTANEKDVVRDLSYLKVTTPSSSTLALIKTLDKDLSIALFYPQGNEVRSLLTSYFESLAKAEPRISVSFFDKDMAPTQAEKYRVSRNGQVVLELDGKRSRLDTGESLSKARKTLAKLDGEFQKRFREVTAQKKIAYFTRGHGEASWLGDARQNPLRSLRTVEAFLRQQSYTLKLFGVAEGSASAVPDDASVVVIAGPRTPFQQAEVDALKAYLDRGGAIMALLDLEKADDEADLLTVADKGDAKDPLRDLLAEAGLDFKAETLGNDRNHVSATRSKADMWFIFSNIFTSHESVTSLARHEERIAVLVYQGGHFEVKGAKNGWKPFETVRSLSDTFVDANRNFQFDKEEKRASYVLGAVAEKRVGSGKDAKEARIVAFADATVASDAVLRNPGNLLYLADSLKWLVGEEEQAGEVASEEDVRIRHTRKEDLVWFNGTVIAMPLLVLGVGFVATRRGRRRGASGKNKRKEGGDA